MTTEEFNVLMEQLVSKLRGAPSRSLRRDESWQLSYDNAAVHSNAEKVVQGINRLPHPRKSPDMHKVVEHMHAWLTQKMQAWLLKQDACRVDANAAKRQLQDLFYSYEAASIMADVESLPGTYKAIIAAGGRYPTKRYR